jgi:60 kDa SS-A/Ro ribonucleoprotein
MDSFEIYTDNETWAGAIHPHQALKKYRDSMGIHSKLIVNGMTATQFTIADPKDAGTLDVVGFDASTPQLVSDFICG